MFSGPQHSHLHLLGVAGGQVGAHAAPRRGAALPSEPKSLQCTLLPLFHLWGSLSAEEHFNVCSALPWPCSLSDYRGSESGLLECPGSKSGRQGRQEKNDQAHTWSVINWGGLKGGQSSELSTGNQGPEVGSSKSRSSRSRGLGHQGPGAPT